MKSSVKLRVRRPRRLPRLEEMLAAGCGVCGIERFSRECTMLVHNQSQRHAAAVEKAARTAAAVSRERCSSC